MTSLRVIIAARGGPEAKSRLGVRLDARQRAALALAMLADMLDALADSPASGRVHVVTPTPELASLAGRHGAQVVLEPRAAGLNAAFSIARQRLVAEDAGGLLALLPGDLPRLTGAEMAELASSATAGSVIVAPAMADGGTGAIVQPAALALPLAFGPGSFSRHCAAAARIGAVVRAPIVLGLSFDLDRPEDLDRLAASSARGRTAALARAFRLDTGAAA